MNVRSLSNKGSTLILLLLVILTTSLFSQNRAVELSSFYAQLNVNNVELFWVTESETNNLGWNIYRGESADAFQNDEVILINPELIEGAGTTYEPTEYEYVDEYEVIPGSTYWYWLESIDSSGVTDVFGPVDITITTMVFLISFSAQSIPPGYVEVSWTTANENNLSCFQIYRNDLLIQTVDATNSPETTTYTFIDTEVESGEFYIYDLEVVDLNGTSFTIGSTTINFGYPVFLSSFDIVYENDILTLYWVTQSETNNVGWNIYRSDTDSFDEAFQINSSLIPGAGTTTEPTNYEFIDENEVNPGDAYWYWLEARDNSGSTTTFGPVSITIPETSVGDELLTNSANILNQNHPNPFRNNTEISFSVTQTSRFVTLDIFNIKGQKVQQFSIDGSRSSIKWNGRDESGKPVAAGIYFYRLQTEDFSAMKKMVLIR